MGCSFSNFKKRQIITCRKCRTMFRESPPLNVHLPICDHCLAVMPIEEKLDFMNSVQFLNKEFEPLQTWQSKSIKKVRRGLGER